MKRLIGLLVLIVLLGACGSAAADEPPEISYGRDECDECHMIIDDPRSAAAYRLPDGTAVKFDDIGGLLIHGHEAGELADAKVWVHDYETEEWIEGVSAWYVHSSEVSTPMAFGIAALSDEQQATDFAAEVGGEVMRWDDLVEMASEGVIEPHELMDEGGMLDEHGEER